ncbi:MAG: mucin-2 protein, partial [Gemmatimonadales bacterium]|nr:mucin-2 protein [Gemmatimonadales bacterium]
VEVVVKGEPRWVTAGYLSSDKPVGPAAGLSMAPCPDSSVENGLTTNAIRVYRSVCHAFPQITRYGGWDAHGEHSSGRALDIMTSDVALGTAIADYLRAHAAELHLYDVIWRQHIWTPVRSGEGWRPMSNRGSATANHYDHVHVSTY